MKPFKKTFRKVFVSTKVGEQHLRFSVFYNCSKEADAMFLAKAEWKFPEYFMLAVEDKVYSSYTNLSMEG